MRSFASHSARLHGAITPEWLVERTNKTDLVVPLLNRENAGIPITLFILWLSEIRLNSTKLLTHFEFASTCDRFYIWIWFELCPEEDLGLAPAATQDFSPPYKFYYSFGSALCKDVNELVHEINQIRVDKWSGEGVQKKNFLIY